MRFAGIKAAFFIEGVSARASRVFPVEGDASFRQHRCSGLAVLLIPFRRRDEAVGAIGGDVTVEQIAVARPNRAFRILQLTR